MTKKNFKDIAQILGKAKEDSKGNDNGWIAEVSCKLADYFLMKNEKFDEKKFHQAIDGK